MILYTSYTEHPTTMTLILPESKIDKQIYINYMNILTHQVTPDSDSPDYPEKKTPYSLSVWTLQ